MMKKFIRMARTAPRTLGLLCAMTLLSRTADAQGWLTLGTDSATRRVVPSAKIVVTVRMDMTNAAGRSVDAISPAVEWNPAFLTLDSILPAAFGPLANIDSVRTAGTLNFDATSTTPRLITTDIATLYFTTGPNAGGTRVLFAATDASSLGAHFGSGPLVGWTQDMCVALPGVWGDVNADSTVDIIDAQQIARSVVGATITDSTRLANNGDVNGDGEVDILDAQGLARSAVGLSAPARIGQERSVVPTTATLAMNHETLTLPLNTTRPLLATPFDANGFTIVGCQTSTWASSNSAVVRVSPTGQVSAVSSGTATITATSGTATAESVITVP